MSLNYESSYIILAAALKEELEKARHEKEALAGGLKDDLTKRDQEGFLLKQQLDEKTLAMEQMEGTLRTTAEEASAG